MTPTLDLRRRPPEIDVPALVRRNLATYASVLKEAETLTRDAYRDREVNRLCGRVRPIAVPLVDAFGVPAEMLRSPDLLR